MHALSLLQNSLADALVFLHRARMKAVFATVASLLGGGRLSLTALGRHMLLPKRGRRRHQIKRVDRLLGNTALLEERPEIYRVIAHRVIGAAARVPIIVDWTPVGPNNEFHALVASVPVRGRVIPIYTEVHSLKKLSNPHVERRFLTQLGRCIPSHCRPIIVTDAGFRVPWFQAVLKLGWDFLGRGRGLVQVQTASGEWFSIRQLFRRARRQPSDLGTLAITHKNFPARVVLCRKNKRNRPQRVRDKRRELPAKRNNMNQSERHRAAGQEPWLLLTSCQRLSPRRVIALYKTRMATEETFRDIKSHRFGWSFEDARCTKPTRYEILLLIAALAMLVVLLTGMVAEQLKLHRGHQANTIRHKRVLSLFFLGRVALADRQDRDFRPRDFADASAKISRNLNAIGL